MACVGGCCCFQCVHEMEAGVVEYCGKFDRVAPSGFACIKCPCEQIVSRVSLRINYMEVVCDTKTKDNVFVKVVVAIQYKVIEDKVPSAFYKLTDHRAQIKSYVNDVVRSFLPTLELDDAFASKEDLARSVKTQLSTLMIEYGYEIIATLVTDLDPNAQIKAAMNEINASQRMRLAAAEKAEAEKILQVKAAEAEAESKYLKGLGVAKQRTAIVDGLKSTVTDFTSEVDNTSASEVMDLLLVTQYFDMLKDVGIHTKSNSTIFLPHGPTSVRQLREEMAKTFKRN